MSCAHMKRFIRYYLDSPVHIDIYGSHELVCEECDEITEAEEWDEEIERIETKRWKATWHKREVSR